MREEQKWKQKDQQKLRHKQELKQKRIQEQKRKKRKKKMLSETGLESARFDHTIHALTRVKPWSNFINQWINYKLVTLSMYVGRTRRLN